MVDLESARIPGPEADYNGYLLGLESADWMVAYDYMLERHEPRIPGPEADYNGYLLGIHGIARDMLEHLLPNRRADVKILSLPIVFLEVVIYDIVALKIMFRFLGVKQSHIQKVISQCKFLKPSTGH